MHLSKFHLHLQSLFFFFLTFLLCFTVMMNIVNQFKLINLPSKVLQVAGLGAIGYLSYKYATKIAKYVYTLRYGAIDLKSYGDWALITGCTDSIGRAYAESLAEKGFNLVLVNRSLAKLNKFSNQLIEKYKIKTKVITIDFTDENTSYEQILKDELDGHQVGVLVNNVGIFHQNPDYFSNVPPSLDKLINDMINSNIVSVTKITAIILPGMVKRGGGIIVNNTSESGKNAIPLTTVYSASKSYVDYFSRAIAEKYKSKGIIVQSICSTSFVKVLEKLSSKIYEPNAKNFVKISVKTIGYESVKFDHLARNIQIWKTVSALSPCFKQKLDVKESGGVNENKESIETREG